MRQATNREKAAKIAEKDPFGPVDEQLDRSAASEEVNTAAMAQVRRVERGAGRGLVMASLNLLRKFIGY